MKLYSLNAVALALVVLSVLGVVVPTAAVHGGGHDQAFAGPPGVSLQPADGPNGEYATVENGELRVDFDRLNETMYHQPTRRIRSISNENQIYTTVAPLATHDDS